MEVGGQAVCGELSLQPLFDAFVAATSALIIISVVLTWAVAIFTNEHSREARSEKESARIEAEIFAQLQDLRAALENRRGRARAGESGGIQQDRGFVQNFDEKGRKANLAPECGEWSPAPPDSELFPARPPSRVQKGLEAEGPTVPTERWTQTLQWRQQNRIDGILDEPQPMFARIKELYKHAYSRTKDGHVVYWHRPGQSDMSQLCALDPEIIQRHFVFLRSHFDIISEPNYPHVNHSECCFRVLCPDPKATIYIVYDLSNIGMSDLAGESMELIKRLTKLYQTHYVGRSARPILIINANWAVRTVWSMVRPLLAARTQKKVLLVGSDCLSTLEDVFGREYVPSELGGPMSVTLENSPEEALIRSHVEEILAAK